MPARVALATQQVLEHIEVPAHGIDVAHERREVLLRGIEVGSQRRHCAAKSLAILGRANARLIGSARDGEWVAEVTRVASDGTTPHAASKALGAITRVALDLGWTRLVSYTLLGEAGTIYRACGWWPVAISQGGEHDRPSRRRRAAQQPGPKARWETGPAALPRDAEVDRTVRANIGRVPIPPRRSQLPLFNEGARP